MDSKFATWIITSAFSLCACGTPPMSDADRSFDAAISERLQAKLNVDLRLLAPDHWSIVCAIGETKPSSELAGYAARADEQAFDFLFDATTFDAPSSALAFVYPDGVEVRPVSKLHINMGSPVNRCVAHANAVLIHLPDGGWMFRDYPGYPQVSMPQIETVAVR